MARDDAAASASPSGPLEPDPGLAVEVRSWLELAALDLEAARRLAADPDFARLAGRTTRPPARPRTRSRRRADPVRLALPLPA